MADAAHAVLTGSQRDPGVPRWSGNFYTDEQVLTAAGVTDFRPTALVHPKTGWFLTSSSESGGFPGSGEARAAETPHFCGPDAGRPRRFGPTRR